MFKSEFGHAWRCPSCGESFLYVHHRFFNPMNVFWWMKWKDELKSHGEFCRLKTKAREIINEAQNKA